MPLQELRMSREPQGLPLWFACLSWIQSEQKAFLGQYVPPLSANKGRKEAL